MQGRFFLEDEQGIKTGRIVERNANGKFGKGPPKQDVTCAYDACDAPASPHKYMGSRGVLCPAHAIPSAPKLKRSKSMHHGLKSLAASEALIWLSSV